MALPTCNEGAYIKWELTLLEVYNKLTHRQVIELMTENFGEENRRYHTLDVFIYKLRQSFTSFHYTGV